MPKINAIQMINQFETKLTNILEQQEFHDASHDLAHFKRVWKTAQEIMKLETERADALTIMAAALLHDIVSLPKNDPNRHKASGLAAKKAFEILSELDFPKDKIENVCHAVEAHSFSANIETKTIEAKIVQDADRIEALGAIGIARCFYIGGMLGTPSLFDGLDPLADNRELRDDVYVLDHFKVKLLKLPTTMQSTGGKKLATIRTKVITDFMDQLAFEARI